MQQEWGGCYLKGNFQDQLEDRLERLGDELIPCLGRMCKEGKGGCKKEDDLVVSLGQLG